MKNKKGFTIVELVIVIAVIAILAAVLIPTFTTVTANARATAALQQAKNAQTAVLGNTEGTMPEGSSFAVDNDNDNAVNYYFVVEGRKIVQKEFKDGITLVVEGEGDDAHYNVFVTADYFGDKYSTVKGQVEGLVQDVCKKAFGAQTAFVATNTVDTGKEYATWTYTVGEAVKTLRVYYNADIAASCVAFLAK